MIRGLVTAIGAAAISIVAVRSVGRRASGRLLDAPRTTPDEAALGPALDALGGEVLRLRARDGVRLAGRWLPVETGDPTWTPDPHEAIVLLHGYTGSIAPDLVEYGPYLRRTAGVLGLDFRGHGGSDGGPSTFGLLETEDIAGALDWLGERGITRVALMGTSMGGIAAIAAVAVLGDGSLPGADMDPSAPLHVQAAPRPRIVGVVADSVTPELEIPIASRLPGPAKRFTAARLFDGASRTLGADPRATEPARVIGLLEPLPVLLIHGAADDTVPLDDGRRLASLAGPSTQHWVVPGAGHSGAHAHATEDYERRTTDFLRMVFGAARGDDADRPGPGPIIDESGSSADTPIRATPMED
jgi:pimeloyl-ACP methyl ester carboxylesterase